MFYCVCEKKKNTDQTRWVETLNYYFLDMIPLSPPMSEICSLHTQTCAWHNVEKRESRFTHSFDVVEAATMLALTTPSCENVTLTHAHGGFKPDTCIWREIQCVLDHCGRTVYTERCQCNDHVDNAPHLMHIRVAHALDLHDALAIVRSQAYHHTCNDTLCYLEELELIVFLTITTWIKGRDLLLVRPTTGTKRVCLQWIVPMLATGCAYLPLGRQGLLVSNFHLGPTPVIFEHMTDMEMQHIDSRDELPWYCKAFAVACKLKHIVSGGVDIDTLYFYDLGVCDLVAPPQ